MIRFSHIAILAHDLDGMERFYQAVFSMKTVWKKAHAKIYMTTGNGDIFAILRKAGHKNKLHNLDEVVRDPNVTPNFPHFGVVVASEDEFALLFHRATNRGIKVAGPKVSRDTTKSFYILDPEHNCVQIVLPPQDYFRRSFS